MTTINLGQLDDFNERDTVDFTFNGVEYSIAPTADTVLRFTARRVKLLQEAAEAGVEDSGLVAEQVFELAGILADSEYDHETGLYTSGVFYDLVNAGLGLAALGRLATTVVAKWVAGDDVAAEYFKTGDLGKAVMKQKRAMEREMKRQRATLDKAMSNGN